MSDLVKKIKIKKQDGTFTDYIPIGAEAQNISTSDGDSVQLKLNKKPYYYNSVADMKADTKLKAGDMAVTLGYYEPNDGGGAEYRIVSGTYTDDSGSYHQLNNSLYAELIIKENTNVKQFGAKSDLSFNSSLAFQAAINAIANSSDNNILNIPSGKYYIATTLNVPAGIRILGNNKTMYHDWGQKAVTIYRKSNITVFSLIGDFSISGDRRADIEISNITFVWSSSYSGEKTQPAIKTQRAIYCHFTDLVFRGGPAFFLGRGSFDSRVYNCDFVDSTIETESTVTDEYHDAIWYGVNQWMFFGCRFEGNNFSNSVLKFGTHTREMYFYGTKFECTMQDNVPLWDFSQGAGDIFMEGVRITFNAGHLGYLGNFKDVSRSFFDITCVDNATTSNYAYFKMDNVGPVDMTFYLSKDISTYSPSYFIDNVSTLGGFNFVSNIISNSYYSSAKALYSNPVYQNKANTILNTTSLTANDHPSVLFKITKEGESTQSFKITPLWENFTNNVPRLDFSDPDGNACMSLRNASVFMNKGLKIPYLTSQAKNYTLNGDLFVNAYTDSNIPMITFGIQSTSRRIGWSDAAPTSGSHTKGTIIFNTNPTAGGNIGWVCITDGNPGTWKAFGNIEN